MLAVQILLSLQIFKQKLQFLPGILEKRYNNIKIGTDWKISQFFPLLCSMIILI